LYYSGLYPLLPSCRPQQPDGTPQQLGFVLPPPITSGFKFNDQSVRLGFIRKVHFILTLQQLFTFGAISLFMWPQTTKLWLRRRPEMFWIALCAMIITLMSMACCWNARRKAPLNFMCLTLFTLAQAFLVAVTTDMFNWEEVVLVIGITMAVSFWLTLFTFQTKWDFTAMGGILFATVLSLILFAAAAILFPDKTIPLVCAVTVALIYSVLLVYDTQLMLSGRHKFAIDPEEYVFAALNLNIFHVVPFRVFCAFK
uniref:Uncharacterized protein n=1 Tax=Anopheles dirus TaxID=7168 RepID=A0A182NKB8_9DIPT